MYESFEAAKRTVCAREPVFAHPQPPTRLNREREGKKKTRFPPFIKAPQKEIPLICSLGHIKNGTTY